MKIALVILHADATRGGAERYTMDLAGALARSGHDVSLLATDFASPPPDVQRVELTSRGATRAGRFARMLDALDAHLDRSRYDVVHAMLPVRRCDVYHPHAGMALSATKRWNIHFNPRRKLMASVERELLAGSRIPVVIALSDYVKRSIGESYPQLPEDRLATLFNAVDLSRFDPSEKRGTGPLLPGGIRGTGPLLSALFVGQDFVRKGLPQTLAAMEKLNDAPLRLTVIGKQGRATPGTPPNVTIVGQTPDTCLYYRAADFFVLPTRHDPCSLVVLEALAMGLPVISTRFNGACEVMTDGVHGFVLDDPDDINALAGAMRKMLDPDLRARMSRACLELRPKLSYEHHLSNLLAIYQRIIDSKR